MRAYGPASLRGRPRPCSFPPLRRGGRGGGGRASADPERSIGRVGGVRARPGSPPLPPLRKGGKGATESAAEDIPVKRKFVGFRNCGPYETRLSSPPHPTHPYQGGGLYSRSLLGHGGKPHSDPLPPGGGGAGWGGWQPRNRAEPWRSPWPSSSCGRLDPRSATRPPTNTPSRSRPTSSSGAARWSTAPGPRHARGTWRSGGTGSWPSGRSRSIPGRRSSTPRRWSSRRGSSTCTRIRTRGSSSRRPGSTSTT